MALAAQKDAFKIEYGSEIEAEIARLEGLITRGLPGLEPADPRWLALKLLEGDPDLLERVGQLESGTEVLQEVHRSGQRLAPLVPDGLDIAIADLRYDFIGSIVDEVVSRPDSPVATISERIDRVVVHRWFGIPIFLFVMYLVFNLVVNVSAPFLDWVDAVMAGPFSRWLALLLGVLAAPAWLESLVLDGVVAGVGGVLVFLPGLVLLYFFIGLLEDTGYMARAAFVMHRFMAFLGLHGKSFVPMILGFGCAVPAIYATRTIERQRDRILTGLLVPLMSCSARLPVYVVFGMAFFGRSADLVIWGLYALGILAAIIVGAVFSRLIFRTQTRADFVLELPPYRLPTWKSLWLHVSQRTGEFIRGAGTLILSASVVIWLLLNLPLGTNDLRTSLFGRVSGAVAPALAPAGFGTWDASGSLITGLIAKEVVISTMSQIYLGAGEEIAGDAASLTDDLIAIGSGFLSASAEAGRELLEMFTPGWAVFDEGVEASENTALSTALRTAFTPLSALAFLVFVLLYVPCIATLGTIRGEFGSKWAAVSAVYQTGLAWALATAVYQTGRLLGLAV